MKYQMKVRGLSGRGMQIAPSVEDPDRSCRVACQDKFIAHRFYLVNGEHGYFPFGISCSFKANDDKRFCVNGKCIKFGADETPVSGMFFNNFSARMKRSASNSTRIRRHYTNFPNQNYTENLTNDYLQGLIKSFDFHHKNYNSIDIDVEQLDLHRPVDIHNLGFN
jgi:hypothetical protein